MKKSEKLRTIITEADNLLKLDITNSSPEFKAWEAKAVDFLEKVYGKKSTQVERFKKTSFFKIHYDLEIQNANRGYFDREVDFHSFYVQDCHDGLTECIAVFNGYLQDFEEEIETKIVNDKFDKIFIVHGHDDELKQAVARLIEKQGIKAIILSEQIDPGKTIIEKIEKHGDVSAAICLFTPDDLGKVKTGKRTKPRARQNVVLEAGYFIGRLGRERVILIATNDIELPSDLNGVVYTDKSNWQFELLQGLKQIGFNIDYNKLD